MGQKVNVAQRTLYDIRDNNSYTIRKLADGNCWMTENLRLEFDGNTTYDSTTTNLAAGTTITPSTTQARMVAPTQEEIEEWRISESSPAEGEVNRWLSRTMRELRESDVTGGDITGEDQLLGAYYNWYTAVAGTGTALLSGQSATEDICPANWQLPIRSGNRSFTNLIVNAYNIISAQGEQTSSTPLDMLHLLPISLPLSGMINSASGNNVKFGERAAWWTSTSAVTEQRPFSAIDMYITNEPNTQLFVIWTIASNSKVGGFQIRCVAK